MKGALPEASYSILKLVPPNIWVFSGRADYKAKTGLDAPIPDFSRAWKTWMDRTAAGQRRVSYQFLDIGNDGNVIRTENGRPALYSDMLPEYEASTVNFPPEGNFTPEVGERIRATVTLPLPVRPLYDDEDIARDPFKLYVVNTASQCTNAKLEAQLEEGLNSKLVEILRILNELRSAVIK